MRKYLYLFLSGILLLSACEDYGIELPNCELKPPPSDTVPFQFEIDNESYLRYTIDGVVYGFRGESLARSTTFSCPNDPSSCSNLVTTYGYRNIFEIDLVHPDHEDTLLSAVGQESFFLNDEILSNMENPAGEANFTLFDDCGRTISVSEEDASSYQHKILNVEVLSQTEGRNNAGNLILSTILEVEGSFQGTFVINGVPKLLTGDYRFDTYVSRRK